MTLNLNTMSEPEFRQFEALLKRFVEEELDQWELWRTETKYGPVYIQFSRYPFEGTNDDSYDTF